MGKLILPRLSNISKFCWYPQLNIDIRVCQVVSEFVLPMGYDCMYYSVLLLSDPVVYPYPASHSASSSSFCLIWSQFLFVVQHLESK